MKPLLILAKSLIAGYARRDGVYVKPHSDKRTKRAKTDSDQLVLFPPPAKKPLPPNRFKGLDPIKATGDLFEDQMQLPVEPPAKTEPASPGPRELTREQAEKALDDAWWGGKNKNERRSNLGHTSNDDGSGWVDAHVPLSKVRPNESGDLYDGTANESRVREYAGKRIDTPIRLVYGERMERNGAKHANVHDGGHRVSAARLRGDTHIRAIMQRSHYDRLMNQ